MLTVMISTHFFCRKVYQGDSSKLCIAGVVCEFEFPSRYCKYAVLFPHHHLRSLTYTQTIDTTRGMPQGGCLSLMQLLVALVKGSLM